MTTTKISKNAKDEFGNDYTVELLPEQEIIEAIEGFSIEEMIEKALEEHVDMQGFRTRLYIDCETGELDPHGLLGQTYLQKQAHRVALAVFSSPITEGLRIEDLLDPEEIDECNEKGIEPWDYIEDMDSEKYQQRLVEALAFYFDLNWDSINGQLEQIYR